jgi:DNA mismatch repair ATPase MutS
MYPDCDFDLRQELPSNAPALTQDLELDTLFNAMSFGDKLLYEVSQTAVLCSLSNGLDTILYRQAVLKDCLNNPSIIRSIYAIAIEAIEKEKKVSWGFFSKYPSAILRRAVDVLQNFVEMLKKLRNIADDAANRFESEGFITFFSMLNQELSDEYFAKIQKYLKELKFPNGVLISADLGEGNQGVNYLLRKQPEKKQSFIERIFAKKAEGFTFCIDGRDETGNRALSELNDRGINSVANSLAQSTDHILGFFRLLRTELAFYIGCLNLHQQLTQKGEPVSFPVSMPPGQLKHSFKGLYDVCLALRLTQKVVGNDLNADNKNLVIIAGANQGGKSTFLRSIGLAQLMMQCGIFVPAESFCANGCDRLFTHYKRQEDTTMNSGKLDEELSRMSAIVDEITSNSMVLFNESFAATNEREGSEIASQIVSALLEKGIKVFFVTHLFEFAHSFYARKMATFMFLRAERQADGKRTFKLIEAEPLRTSYGKDLYQTIFEIAH